jgi:hypothetical protein
VDLGTQSDLHREVCDMPVANQGACRAHRRRCRPFVVEESDPTLPTMAKGPVRMQPPWPHARVRDRPRRALRQDPVLGIADDGPLVGSPVARGSSS